MSKCVCVCLLTLLFSCPDFQKIPLPFLSQLCFLTFSCFFIYFARTLANLPFHVSDQISRQGSAEAIFPHTGTRDNDTQADTEIAEQNVKSCITVTHFLNFPSFCCRSFLSEKPWYLLLLRLLQF